MKKKINLATIIKHIVLMFLTLCCIIPFLLVVSVSLTDEIAINVNGYSLIPSQFSLEAYKLIFKDLDDILSAYGYTIIITIAGTAAGTMIMAMIAYAISRRNFAFRRAFSLYLSFPMLFSGGMVPTYLWVAGTLGMKDTIWVLFLPICISVWNIFMLRVFFQDVPDALYESAAIDGANEFYCFFIIGLPLAKIGIVIVALFTALTLWNDWFQSMLYIDRSEISTLQYLLYRLMNKTNLAKEMGTTGLTTERLPQENLRMALCVVAAGPMMFIFPFFQKYFAKGITLGSVKG